MNEIKKAGRPFGILALLLVSAAQPCLAQPGVSDRDELDLPAIVLPIEDVAAGETSATDAAATSSSDLLMATIKSQISERYLAASSGETGAEQGRIDALLDGSYLEDYSATSRNDPIHFTNGIFTPRVQAAEEPGPESPDIPRPSDAAVSGFLMTPEAIRAMSQMSADQIEAIALMVQISQNPEGAPVAAPQLQGGIPALSDEDIKSRSPEEIIAEMGAMSSAEAPGPRFAPEPPRVLDVGSGQDLALDNWELIVEPDGKAYLDNGLLPGSRVEIEPGVTVGVFGRVTEISSDESGFYVVFESGDRIEGPSPIGTSVPEVSGEAMVIAGEIIISGAAETQPGQDVAEAAPAQPSDLAPTQSPRPPQKPRKADDEIAKTETSIEAPDMKAEVRPQPKPERVRTTTSTSPLAPTTAPRPNSKPDRP